MAYHFHILFPFVSTILHSTVATGHTARRKALTLLLQGLRVFHQASVSGLGRGIAVLDEEKSCRGQRKKAHRLLKHEKRATWDTGAAFFAPLMQELPQVCLAVDWTALGAFRVLEACLIVEGRGIPLYSQGYPDLSLLGLRCQETRGSQCFCRKSRFASPVSICS